MERAIAKFSFFFWRLRTLSAAGSYLPAFKPREENRLEDGCWEGSLMLVVAWGSARSAPWAKVSFETFSRGLEGRPHDRALLGSFCAKRPSADEAYNHRTSWNQRVTISAEAAPYAYHISHCEVNVVRYGRIGFKMNNFLLLVSWESCFPLVLPMHCASVGAAIQRLDRMAGFVPEPLQVVAFVEADEAWFKSKFELVPAAKINGKEWFHFELSFKQFVCTSVDRRPALQKLASPTLMEALDFPSIVLSHAEKLSIKQASNNLPAFVTSAEAFVLWAIATVNEKQDFCISSSIVKHPACVYTKGTIYNALTAACNDGLAQVTIVAGSRVFTLTNAGMQRFSELEEGYNAAHPRKSVKSLYGGLL